MLNPNEAYIALSRRAGDLLRALGVASNEDNADEIKRMLIGCISSGGVSIVNETKEVHFLAEARIKGVHCYLLCVSREGSPAGNKTYTTTIKGVMLPSDARDLLRIGKGLAPIGRTIAAYRWED